MLSLFCAEVMDMPICSAWVLEDTDEFCQQWYHWDFLPFCPLDYVLKTRLRGISSETESYVMFNV